MQVSNIENDSDRFSFDIPVDIVKSTTGEKDEPEMRIAGYASTEDEDRQGDSILQKGLDISDFVNFGWFNFDHNNEKILGYPDKTKCKIDSHGFYVEGTLLKGNELAKSMWETAVALRKANAPRHLGFSVEGKVLKRNELGKILKAKVYNVALTYNPVNTSCTWDALVKSFTDNEDELDKALTAGHYDANGSDLISEDLGTDIEKRTMEKKNQNNTANGDVDIPDAVDDSFKTLSYIIGNDDKSEQTKKALKKCLEGRDEITKSEYILYLQLTKGLSFKDSASLVNKYIQ